MSLHDRVCWVSGYRVRYKVIVGLGKYIGLYGL